MNIALIADNLDLNLGFGFGFGGCCPLGCCRFIYPGSNGLGRFAGLGCFGCFVTLALALALAGAGELGL
jgi:hypothetical protein